ncbi:RNA-directed RNA polymerase 2, partial [Mycena maculata]
MDVHMQGISFSITKHQLDAGLAKILHKAPYAVFSTVLGPVNFHVYLFKDSRGGKLHSGGGTLTLLKDVALHFLQEYGEKSDGTPPPKIFKIGGRRVKFSEARTKPRVDVVQKLVRFPYVDPSKEKEKESREKIFDGETIVIRTLQFGWNCRDSVFSVEWEEQITGSLKINEERREIRIAIPQSNLETLFVAIRLSRISQVLIHSELSTRSPIIFLSLAEPPNFEYATGPGPRQRLSYLPISDHERVAPFTSIAIRLICGHHGDLGRFQRLAKTAGMHNVHEAELHTEHRGLFSPTVLGQLKTQIKALRWSVAFQAEALYRNLYLDPTEVLAIMPDIRHMGLVRGKDYTTAFLRHFGTQAQFWGAYGFQTQTIQQFFAEVHTQYLKFHAKAPSLDPSDKSVFQSLHVVISPTTIYLQGPFVKRSNRVIRSFHSRSHDSFLRVSFMDEGNLQYRSDRELDCVEFTQRRVGEFLIDKGLTIAGRHFDFLAYSQSALKEHAVWFVRPFRDHNGAKVNTSSIIQNLGSFDGLAFDPRLMYCPARYAARISQAFTATDSTSIEVEEIISIGDISAPSGNYDFTDGVGTMSLELAKGIWEELRASRRRNRRVKNHPRAYQIRFQGCKGMLSVDYKLKGHVICIRPSMVKFNAPNSQTIDIARAFDKPGPYFLNRPLITIMEGLGIPYDVFKGLQDRAVREAQGSTRSLKTFATMLETHGLGASFRLPSVLLGLTQLGIETLSGDNFYSKLLEFAVYHVLRLLKTKARIPVPHGVTLVGVADVHKYLQEGEIFACARAPDSNRLNYIEGDVLISRSPTIHPGDVRLVRAIGKPPPGTCFAREPLPNTVVFSVLGARPLPSCLGGGDLDGDTYNIIPLDKCPGFRPERTYRPAEYTPAPKKLIDHPSTMKDVAEFVIEYINSDVVGMVATNWLLIADQSERGIWDSDCIKLADLHSDAVDYPKTGRPVAINTIPKPKEKCRPDWHAPEVHANLGRRFGHDYYASQRTIGKLFRAIELPEIQAGITGNQLRERMRAPNVDDLAVSLDGFDIDEDPVVMAIEAKVSRFIQTHKRPAETVEYIAQIFHVYVSEIQGLRVAHTLSHAKSALISEEEVVVGTIISKTSQPRKRQDMIASLREKSDHLVRGVKEELMGDDEVSWKECLRRAWLAFELAIGSREAFGAQSFMWIAVGTIFDAIKEIEEEKESRSRR